MKTKLETPASNPPKAKWIPPNAGKGRKKGVPNKITTQVREAMELAFQAMGGQEAFNRWARANPDVFYERILPKLLPVQVNHAGADGGAIEITWLARS